MSPPHLTAAALIAGLRPILVRYPEIAAAWVFGSAARQELRADSDIDIGLLLRTKGETAEDHYEMLGDLAARLESVTAPHPIDVVLLEPQGPIFAHEALCDGKLICEPDPERRIQFEADTVARAIDFRPTYELALSGQAHGLRRRLRSTP